MCYHTLQWKRIARHFCVIWKADQFLQISGESFKILLAREDLTCSRIDLARALLRWINYDRASRTAWLQYLAPCLRLYPQEFGTVAISEEFFLADYEAQEAIRQQVVCAE